MVGTDDYSDWSLAPMDPNLPFKATFSFQRRDNTLWVYAMQAGSEKLVPIRELKWAFAQHRLHEEIWVGVYAAKPTPDRLDAATGLPVLFSGLDLEQTVAQD